MRTKAFIRALAKDCDLREVSFIEFDSSDMKEFISKWGKVEQGRIYAHIYAWSFKREALPIHDAVLRTIAGALVYLMRMDDRSEFADYASRMYDTRNGGNFNHKSQNLV